MTTRSEFHTETAHVFLAKARTYLAEGDLLQAAEKGWGAAAHSVKAIAEQRGWRHGRHGDLFRAINRLTTEADDRSLHKQFLVANGLHNNFYDGELPRESVAAGLEEVEQLVRHLQRLST
uniref:HEPN domain-containing protein n=1 Tax=uncultured microorganism TaxID=358574 RepID=E0X6P6_9ZZZZ|nr:protein of unknown function [uncultured microorganism]